MHTFQKKGVMYAAAMRLPCGLWPNRHECVILRKTDERVSIRNSASRKQHERIVWRDEGNEPYVRWEGKFWRIDSWYMFTRCWHIDHQHTPLVDA